MRRIRTRKSHMYEEEYLHGIKHFIMYARPQKDKLGKSYYSVEASMFSSFPYKTINPHPSASQFKLGLLNRPLKP